MTPYKLSKLSFPISSLVLKTFPNVLPSLLQLAVATMDRDVEDGGGGGGGGEAVRQASSAVSLSAAVSPAPSLRRKQLMWQNAVRNVIEQHNLYSLRLAGGLERDRHRITVTDAYIADINR